jgi:hypothetical protein
MMTSRIINSSSVGWMWIRKREFFYFIFYDRRNYDDKTTDVYLAYSVDGGETFTQ